MAEEVGIEYGRVMAGSLGGTPDGQRSFRSALHAVADALTAHGFAAHAEKHGNELRICQRALPLRRRRHRAPGDLRRRPRHGAGHARRALRRHLARARVVHPHGRRASASPPSKPDAADGPPLPRPRVDLAAAARGARGDGRRGSDGRPARSTRAASTPRGMTSRATRRAGPRAGGGAARRPAARGRVHQRRDRGDRRGRAGARPSGAAPGARRRRALGRAGVGERRGASATVDGRRRRPARADRPRRAGRRPSGADTALVHVQWGNHEVGTLQPVAEVVARVPGAGRARARRRGRGRRATCRSRSTTSAPTCCRSAATSSAARPASARCSCGAGLRLRPAPARRRSGAGPPRRAREPARRSSGFGAACDGPAPTARSTRSGRRSRRLTDRARRRSDRARRRRTSYGDPDDRLPHLVCLGIDGVEPQAVLLGLDQAGIAAHSGQRLLLRGARAVARARGHGRRRPPLAAPLGRLEHHRRRHRRRARRPPRPCSTACAPSAPPPDATRPRHARPVPPRRRTTSVGDRLRAVARGSTDQATVVGTYAAAMDAPSRDDAVEDGRSVSTWPTSGGSSSGSTTGSCC